MTVIDKKTRTLVLAALLAALTCVATIVLQIPSPMNGYVNLGDCFVLLSAWTLGPVYGTLAAGIGSMLADAFTGYMHYAPGTFFIKAGAALIAYCLAKALLKRLPSKRTLCKCTAGVVAELFMAGGYFCYSSLLLGRGWAAAASVPGNLIQGAVGVIAATLIAHIFDRYRLFERFGGQML